MPQRIDRARAVVQRAQTSQALLAVTAQAARLSHGGFSQLSVLAEHEVIVAVKGAPIDRGRTVPLEDAVCVHVLRSGAPVAIEDAHVEPRTSYLDVVERDLLVSYLGVPVRVGSDDDIIAVLCVWDQHRREWTEQEVDVLQTVAARAAQQFEQMLADPRGVTDTGADDQRPVERPPS